MKRLIVATLIAAMLPAAQAETLSLDQAVQKALHADPRIKEREKLVDAARALVDQAQGSDDMMVDVNTFVGLAPGVSGGFYQNGAKSCSSGCQPRSDLYDFNSLSAWGELDFKLIKPIATFGKVASYTAAAEGNVTVKRAEVREQRAATIYDVSRAYYGYLTAHDSRLLLEDVKGRLLKAKELADRWLADGKGDIKQSDVFALENGLAMINRYLAKAKAVEQVALDGLKVLTGIGMDGELQVADRSLPVVAMPQSSLSELVRKALADRPEMSQLSAGLKARRALVEAKKADRRPNLYIGVVGSLAGAPGRDTLDNPYVLDMYNHVGVTPVIGLNWNYQGGSMDAKVTHEQAKLNALIEKDAFARQGIPFDVAKKYHELQSLREQVKQLADGSRAGRRWMIASYADFEAGLEKADKVLEAFKTYALTQADYISTVDDYDMKLVELNRAVGAYQ